MMDNGNIGMFHLFFQFSLPSAVVDVDSVDLFKSRLDNFWLSQDVKYDYTVNLAGFGDRSEYDVESY